MEDILDEKEQERNNLVYSFIYVLCLFILTQLIGINLVWDLYEFESFMGTLIGGLFYLLTFWPELRKDHPVGTLFWNIVLGTSLLCLNLYVLRDVLLPYLFPLVGLDSLP